MHAWVIVYIIIYSFIISNRFSLKNNKTFVLMFFFAFFLPWTKQIIEIHKLLQLLIVIFVVWFYILYTSYIFLFLFFFLQKMTYPHERLKINKPYLHKSKLHVHYFLWATNRYWIWLRYINFINRRS